MHEGRAFKLSQSDQNIAHLIFDLESESVNKFDRECLEELASVLAIVEQHSDLRALVISSAKPAFAAGADVTEFGAAFASGEAAIKAYLTEVNALFNRLESLPCPVVVAVDGFALGGGMELCLSCDFRLASTRASFGLPETKLGIIPGWGGTVRLPRLAGIDVAVEWIASGGKYPASKALADRVVDGVVEPEQLLESAFNIAADAANGDLDYRARRQQKFEALRHSDTEALLAFESSKAFVKAQSGRHYPAPVAAIQTMQLAAKKNRDDALQMETDAFVKLAQGPVAPALIGIFLGDQLLSAKARALSADVAEPIGRSAVLGAGIMGGEIAYLNATRGVPVIMKDIHQAGIDLGMSSAAGLLDKGLARGKLEVADTVGILSKIQPSLSFEHFDQVEVVIEAVVEDEKIKRGVLAEVEEQVGTDSLICSNTSSISISALATALKRPQNFCGLHFFNPVHRMPLVEVIRGEQSSDMCIARAVAYAKQLGKKVVVVNDCPGFLVNRVLFPYFAGFSLLLRDGADFRELDRVMEAWGWPLGPAALLDVVGGDTGMHVDRVLSGAYTERLQRDFKAPTELLLEAGRLGQKSGSGYYEYSADKKGRLQKIGGEQAAEMIASHYGHASDGTDSTPRFSDEDIVARMMIPMATEVLRCLEEGVVASPAEADMALIYGLGFPPFRGGLLRWIDSIGIEVFADMARQYEEVSPLYKLTDPMRALVDERHVFYPQTKRG